MSNLDAVFWWIGAVVFYLGGAIGVAALICAMLAALAALLFVVATTWVIRCWKNARSMANFRQWVAAGKPQWAWHGKSAVMTPKAIAEEILAARAKGGEEDE